MTHVVWCRRSCVQRVGEEEEGEESLCVHLKSSVPQRSPLSSSPDLPGPVCTPLPDIHSRLSQAVVVVDPHRWVWAEDSS